MNKNEIYIKSGTNYKEMTKELLAQCGLASVISDKKMQIGIKPNLVSPSEASCPLFMFYHINYSAYNSKKTLFKYKTYHNNHNRPCKKIRSIQIYFCIIQFLTNRT